MALCLFGGLVWFVHSMRERMAKAELQQEIDARATIASARENVLQLKKAIELYALNHNALPPLDRWQETLKAEEEKMLAELLASSKYTPAEKKRFSTSRRLEFSDPWGTPYRLRYVDRGYGMLSYNLTCFGRDKAEATDDDIVEDGIWSK